MVKKKIIVFSALAGVLALGAAALFANNAQRLERINATNYVLEMNADTNSYEDIAANEGVAYTALGNPIEIGTSKAENVWEAYEGGAFTLLGGGQININTALTGITSITIDTANGEDLYVVLGYASHTEVSESVVVADDAPFDFNNTQPNYISITNPKANPVSVVSVKINYNCAPQANIWEVKGSFNDWGDGMKMIYNYSYEHIDTQDQWMIKGVELEKGKEFKLRNGDTWLGVGSLDSGEGSAVAAGQLAGSNNIIAMADITVDIYLKVTRGETPTYSIWIGADPDAEVEEAQSYPIYVYAPDWENVKMHGWEGTATDTAWPGVAMTEVEGKDGYWTIDVVEGAYKNILFNTNEGNTKTVDLVCPAIDDTNNCYYVNLGWGTLDKAPEIELTGYDYYFNPGVWETAGAWYAIWSWGSGEDQWVTVTKVEGTIYYGFNLPEGTTGLKVFRMNPVQKEPSFDTGVWNTTGDLGMPEEGKNILSINGWDNPASWGSLA